MALSYFPNDLTFNEHYNGCPSPVVTWQDPLCPKDNIRKVTPISWYVGSTAFPEKEGNHNVFQGPGLQYAVAVPSEIGKELYGSVEINEEFWSRILSTRPYPFFNTGEIVRTLTQNIESNYYLQTENRKRGSSESHPPVKNQKVDH